MCALGRFGHLLVLLLGIGVLGCQALPDPVTEELDLEPSQCMVHSFDVTDVGYNLTVDTSKFPDDCKPDLFLKTTGMHSDGACIGYRWQNIKCNAYVKKEDDICTEWALLGQLFKPTNATFNENIMVEKDWECGLRTVHIGFLSSCSQIATVSLKVQYRNLTADESSFCKLFGESSKVFLENLTLSQIISVLVGSFLGFILISTWMCAQCPCCPLHRWLKVFSDEDKDESRRSRKLDVDSIEEALLEHDVQERQARKERRKDRKTRTDKRPNQHTIPE